MSNDDIKVTDFETLEWMGQLSDADKQTLKLRALERRAVELLQPKAEPPNFGAMTEEQFRAYCRQFGF